MNGAVRPAIQADGEEQEQARDHGQRQADDARLLALMERQGRRDDGDDHDVVDAENDLEAGQGQ